MKKILIFISLILLAACSDSEVKYDGSPLKIAVIGEEIPTFQKDNIQIEPIALNKFMDDSAQISANFDAVMLSKDVFEEASDDKFIDVYLQSEIPIVFLNSSKRHYPFIHENVTYETASESLIDGSHTTIYLHNKFTNEDNAWFFRLNDKKNENRLYTDLFNKIDEL